VRQDAAVAETGDGGDAVGFECEHEQSGGPRDRRVCVQGLAANGWSGVCPGGHQSDGAAAARLDAVVKERRERRAPLSTVASMRVLPPGEHADCRITGCLQRLLICRTDA
jgi:hypothetical protein